MSETIAAISTPNAVGGISVIRVSGPDAITVSERVFEGVSGKKLSSMKGYTAAYGKVYDREGEIDSAVALGYHGPKS